MLTALQMQIAMAQSQTPDTTKLGSLGFGVGIGSTFLRRENILQAQLANGLVRVTEREKTQRGLWLETHYLLDKYKIGQYTSHGPFLAAQVSGDNGVLNALSFGYMMSLKRTKISDSQNNAAFNIGFGWVSTGSKQLGGGITEGAALPPGEEAIRFVSSSGSGWLFLVSFNFFSARGS